MLLKMTDICKAFAGVQVLTDVDFDLKAGDKEITLASRVFTLNNIEAGGDWIE